MKLPKLKGKASRSEILPSRHALMELVGGDKFDRSLNNYAKKTPMMNIASRELPSILQMFPRRRSKF